MADDCPLTPTKELGSGIYGVVSLVQTPIGPRALKVQSYDGDLNNLTELDILSRFQHPNLAMADTLILHQQCAQLIPESSIGILMPLAEGTLFRVSPPAKVELISIFHQLLSGLLFLHQNNYIHLDLKPQNILRYRDFGQPQRIAISDFGLAEYIDDVYKGIDTGYDLVTAPYRPLENLRGSHHWSAATDVWSMGIVFLELISGKNPTYTESFTEASIIERIERLLQPGGMERYVGYNQDPAFKAQVLDLFAHMLDPNAQTRWTALQCLGHPIFGGHPPTPGRLKTPRRPAEPNADQQAVVKKFLQGIPPRTPLGCYFLAMDLMFRAVGIAPDAASYDVYAQTAYTLALIIYRRGDLIRHADEYLEAQLKLTVELEGMIVPPYLFQGARSLTQLQNLKPRFRDLIKIYHVVDVPTLFASVIPPFTVDLPSKEVPYGQTIYSASPGF